jgi:hypothetical protein
MYWIPEYNVINQKSVHYIHLHIKLSTILKVLFQNSKDEVTYLINVSANVVPIDKKGDSQIHLTSHSCLWHLSFLTP